MPTNQPKSSRAPGGPIHRDTDITAQEEAIANDISDEASYQASPANAPSHRDTDHESRTGRIADEAAGIEPHSDQLPEADRALRQSRGSHEPRKNDERF